MGFHLCTAVAVCSLTAAAQPRRLWSGPLALGMTGAPLRRCCRSLCQDTGLPVRSGEGQLLSAWHLVETCRCKETPINRAHKKTLRKLTTQWHLQVSFVFRQRFWARCDFLKEEKLEDKLNHKIRQVHGWRPRHLFTEASLIKCPQKSKHSSPKIGKTKWN